MVELSWKSVSELVHVVDESAPADEACKMVPIAYAAQAQLGPYTLSVLGGEWAVSCASDRAIRRGASGVAIDHDRARQRAAEVAAHLCALL